MCAYCVRRRDVCMYVSYLVYGCVCHGCTFVCSVSTMCLCACVASSYLMCVFTYRIWCICRYMRVSYLMYAYIMSDARMHRIVSYLVYDLYVTVACLYVSYLMCVCVCLCMCRIWWRGQALICFCWRARRLARSQFKRFFVAQPERALILADRCVIIMMRM